MHLLSVLSEVNAILSLQSVVEELAALEDPAREGQFALRAPSAQAPQPTLS